MSSTAAQPGKILAATGFPYASPGTEIEMKSSKMFCAQCSQHSVDCKKSIGDCRKTPEVANMQDMLVKEVKEMGYYLHHARKAGKTIPDHLNHFTLHGMFTTLTNVNNDPARFKTYISNSLKYLAEAKALCGPVAPPEKVDASVLAMRSKAPDANAACLTELLTYGIKGVCAYADHALVFGKEDPRIYAYLHEALAFLCSPERNDLGKALAMCLKCGEANLWTMELLYNSNTTLGKQEPTQVKVSPVPGKSLLVSGHDLALLDSLLPACKAKGVNVYTHGEMLPAHAYPKLKAYGNLVGHYGGSWNRQAHEFSHFPGPIVMTSNCLTEPGRAYKARVYTAGPVGWPGVAHLGDNLTNVKWDQAIESALNTPGFTAADTKFGYDGVSGKGQPSPTQPQMVGFGHDAVLGAAPTVLEGIKSGAISRFFLIGGCDGDAASRNYFTDLSENLPPTSVVLTLGCGKFRVSDSARARLGNVGDTGIPRVLDIGQCNDTYSAVRIALALADVLKCKVSDLPLSIVLSWYEQKAIAVLLTCLHLGLKPIRIGPVLPAFITHDVLQVLVRDFGIIPTGDVSADIKTMMAAKGAS